MFALYVLDLLERKGPSATPIWYFCDSGVHGGQTSGSQIVRGLIFQLLKLNRTLSSYILPQFRLHEQNLFRENMFETQWEIFEQMVRCPSLPYVHCVLDGLDECEPKSLSNLLRKLNKLLPATRESHQSDTDSSSTSSSSSPSSAIDGPTEILECRLSILCTSRSQEPACLRHHLSKYEHVDLDDELYRAVIYRDVRLYVESKIKKSAKSDRIHKWPTELTEKVTRDITKRAEGKYLWAAFAINEVQARTVYEVEDTLQKFPGELTEVYNHLVSKIPEERWKDVVLLLKWVLGAYQPLSLLALSEATSVQPATGQKPEEAIENQVSFCNHLLEIHSGKVI